MLKFICVVSLLLNFLIQTLNGLETSICMLPEKKCKESSNRASCKEAVCAGNYSTQCTSKHCGSSKEKCEEFNDLKKSILIKSEMRKYNKVMRNLKVCPFSVVHVAYANEFCLKRRNCFVRKEFVHHGDIMNLVERIECPCRGFFNKECGNGVCASNESGCKNIDYFGFNLTDLKHCEQIEMITLQKLFNY